MYLESIHKTIKYFYLNGRKNKRMDQCINALLKFIRNNIFDRFIKLGPEHIFYYYLNLLQTLNKKTRIF